MKSADPLDAFDRDICEVICLLVHTTVLRSGSVDKQWFDDSCKRVYDAKQTAYHAWCRARSADHWGRFVLARAEAQRVYGAARESHNERTRNTLKHSTCSPKWWETLKGSIFGVKPSIPALKWQEGGLVVAPAETVSLLGSQFDSKQYREQFVRPLSCFPKSRFNSLAFWTPVLLLLLLDLDTYGAFLWACFLYFKRWLLILLPK